MEQEGGNRRSTALGGGRQRTPVTDLHEAWVEYQHRLAALVRSGSQVSRALVVLAADLVSKSGPLNAPHPSGVITAQCLAGWEDLVRATSIATNTLQQNINTSLLHYMMCINSMSNHDSSESEMLRCRRLAEQSICENILHLVSLQYQFSVACSESLGHLTTCPCCLAPAAQQHDPECSMRTLQQCFSRLYESNEPRSTSASPHHTALDVHAHPGRHYPPARVPPHQASYQYSVSSYVQHTPPPPYGGHAFQGSTDSQYLASEGHRTLYVQPEAYRGLSPIPKQEYMRHITASEGFRPAEPRGPSPLMACHEGIRGPSPSYMDCHRGPLPAPGLLTSTKFKSPLNCQLFPLEGQRRWSEAAAAEMRASRGDDSTMRRWSMPYDARHEAHGHPPPLHPPVLHPPPRQPPPPRRLRRYQHSTDRSRSATPEWQTDTRMNGRGSAPPDGLVDALQLLSHRSTVRAPPPAPAAHAAHAAASTMPPGIAEVWPEEGTIQVTHTTPTAHSRWQQRALETGFAAGSGSVSGSGTLSSHSSRSSGPTQLIAEPIRMFTLFGDNDTLSCLRRVTSPKDEDKSKK